MYNLSGGIYHVCRETTFFQDAEKRNRGVERILLGELYYLPPPPANILTPSSEVFLTFDFVFQH